jgi:hypothetical protein
LVLTEDGRLKQLIGVILGEVILQNCDGALNIAFEALAIGIFDGELVLLDGLRELPFLQELVCSEEVVIAGD